MGKSLNLSLTDELRAFIDRHSGDGMLYATPSEFVRALLREKKERLEAARVRDAIINGYQDMIAGRVIPYSGDMKADRALYRKLKSEEQPTEIKNNAEGITCRASLF